MKYFILVLLGFLISCSDPNATGPCGDDRMSIFIPRADWDGDQFPPDKKLMTKEFFDQVELVFRFYQKSYKRLSDTALRGVCEVTIYSDMEYNYTRKAFDGKWQKQRENIEKRRGLNAR